MSNTLEAMAGEVSLTKLFKRLLNYFNVPFAQACCPHPEEHWPARWNNDKEAFEVYSEGGWIIPVGYSRTRDGYVEYWDGEEWQYSDID